MIMKKPQSDKPILNLTSFCLRSMYRPRIKINGRKIQNPMNPNGLTITSVKNSKAVFWEKMMTSEIRARVIPAIAIIEALSIFFFIGK